ncbi:MAG TPA: hypothetical protein VJ343_02035 [archaeon]|nr:hypothetical protein [archaeon]
MELENARNSIIPNILFFVAVFYLLFSGLSITKAISVQNETTILFMKTLSEKDILFTVIEVLKLIIVKIVLPLLPFLLLISFGFLLVFVLKEKIDSKLFIGLQIAMIALMAAFTGLSVIILFISIGILATSISILRFFDSEKSRFSTGTSLGYRALGWMNILFAVGLFFAMYLNFSLYEQSFTQANMDLLKSFMPDQDQLQKLSLDMVNRTIDGIQSGISQRCEQVDPLIKAQCQAAYATVLADIESYRENITKQASEQNISDEQLNIYIIKEFPIFEQIIKAMPLFLALAFFAMLEVLKPLIALLLGATHSAIGKFI